MKRKIILSLLAIFAFFTAGAAIAILNMSNITAELSYVIKLQQVEQLRRSLMINLQAVQSNLLAVNTPYSDGLDAIVSNVTRLEEVAQQCTSCHHPPQLSNRIAGLQTLIKDYQNSLSYFITTRANTERLERLKTDAVNTGARLLNLAEEMSHRASITIETERNSAMTDMAKVKSTLLATIVITMFMGVFVASLLARSVTRPVKALVRATRSIAAGDYEAKISYRDGTEFEELAGHFNAMSAALKEGYQKNKAEVTERRIAEEALIKSEKFLSTIFDSIRDPFCIFDRDYRIVRTNEAYAHMKNMEVGELVDRKCHEVIHGRSFVCDECVVQASFKSKDPCAKDKLIVLRDGSQSWSEIYTYPIFDEKGEVSHIIEYTRDITDRKKTEAKLRKSEERYALAARGANDGLWDWDLKSNKVFFSPRWKSMLGFTENQIGNNPDEWLKRVHPDDRVQLEMELNSHINSQSQNFVSEHRVQHKDGSYRWMLSRGLAVCDASAKAHRMVGSMTDITERKVAEEQLVFDALHDSLTGLPNRTLFLDRLTHSVEREKRFSKYLFAVLFLDIDRFKVINDSMGHTVGDQLLIAVSKRLEEGLRPGDTVGRFGGDEFAVLLEDMGSKREAIFVVERIQEKLAAPINVNGQEIFVTASIGIAFSATGYEQPEHLLRNADIAMYHAKADRSTDKFKVFDTGMYATAVARLQLETELRQASNQNNFLLHYQPIINMRDGKIEGLEALVRWQHPVQGLVLPGDFISTAEETGLVVEMGEWVIREACGQLSRWQTQFPSTPPLSVSVNISSKQLQPGLIRQVRKIMQETGLLPDTLVLEITESMIMENAELVSPLLKQLKEMRVKLHIDDFGTGYSSLSYLHQFPIDVLKIDSSFVQRIDANTDNLEIVKAIITLARSLNMDVIAEGVESEYQLAQLKSLDCKYVQGFLFSKPMIGSDIEALLKKGRLDLITYFTRTAFARRPTMPLDKPPGTG